MKTLFAKLAGLGMVATLFFASCEKEGDNVTINQTSTLQLTASSTAAVLSKPDADKAAITYTWTPADYGFTAAPSYTLEFDTKGNNFKSARTIGAGTATKYTLTVGELNGIFNDLGQAPGKASELEVRLKSALNGTTGVVMSTPMAIKATPYESRDLPKDVWAIIGSATPGSWDKDTPMTYDFDGKVWTITLALTKDEYKFRANKSWDLNLGAPTKADENKASGPLKAGGDNIKISEAGTYKVTPNYGVSPATYTTVKQ